MDTKEKKVMEGESGREKLLVHTHESIPNHSMTQFKTSAFVPGRRISDIILLTQELMHQYHRQTGPPRCAFKVDIQKAYDTVDWSFLRAALCGNVHGFFKGKRGLRQGDPMFPYLFMIVMEVLTAILQTAASLSTSFKFHNKCEKQMIINLCFADDLFLFARGEVKSAKLIMESLTR
ncbi:uncharacterized protein LOC110933639 [Helianthus annuus]|uniref:uncharacterized protein LOC110933639 n=1 Tax=Helianthus annuus TaxID=4232 RepID=UPI000B903623|nr:uncharacterized protein LOC110933639 [Helianthus annuus]